MASHMGMREVCPNYSQEFPAVLQRGLQELWESECLCDIQLTAENYTFSAHKSVLAAASWYFRIMFTTDMKERYQSSVELKGISAVGLKSALDFIYTSQMCADFESLEDVLLTSTHLQIPYLTECCVDFLKKSLNVNNFRDILSLAEKYDLVSMKTECFSFISTNLDVVLQISEQCLLQLDADSIFAVLERDDVSPSVNEREILELAVKWLKYDLDRRLPHLECLIKHIRLGLIFPPKFEFENENLKDSVSLLKSVPQAEEYLQMLSEAGLQFKADNPFTKWFKIRSTQKGVLTTCGKTTGGQACREITILTSGMDCKPSWKTVANAEETYNHCTVVLNDYLYVIGGQNSWFSSNHKEEAIASVLRYDPRFDRWTRLADMNVCRRRFQCSAMGSQIYAVGGRGERGILFSAECYNPTEDKWRYIKALPSPLSSHAGTVHQNELYVCGGSSGEVFSGSVFRYTPELDEWMTLPPLRHPRGFHNMTSVGDKIYVMGGVLLTSADGQRRSYSDVKVTECYCPLSDQWTELSPLPVGHSQHGAAALGNKIYIMGGFSWEEERFLNTVHVYSCETDTWSTGPELPRPLVGLSSGTLTLPHYHSK
ncbi:kelch-like protein 9 [Acipenser ruthenus]|uniref:kelch-like protein 9 n=1 Tax=Acipenser ruthenus TaxID=7906 RepID=UPI00274149D9|nr:kelch-like protein 9 [Acipenser ruthenus]